MISDIIGGAMKIGGSIFGAVSMSKAMKKVKNNLKEQQQENQDWYNRAYNEDATQRADAQYAMNKLYDNIRDRNRQTAGAQAVSGGTGEALAASKAANAQALADATAQIAVNGERRKDNIEQQYMQRRSAINDQLNNMEVNRAQNMAAAVSGVSDAASGFFNLDKDNQ